MHDLWRFLPVIIRPGMCSLLRMGLSMKSLSFLPLVFSQGLFFVLIDAPIESAEPIPLVQPNPTTTSEDVPDLVPPAVRRAAIKLAGEGAEKIDHFEIISIDQRTVYQVRVFDLTTKKPMLATFMSNGALESVVPISSKRPLDSANEKSSEPTTVPPETLPPSNDTQPKRSDGRDAAPRSREGRDSADHS